MSQPSRGLVWPKNGCKPFEGDHGPAAPTWHFMAMRHSSQPSPETFEPRWRNHLETYGWQKTSINLGLGTGCRPAFVQSLLIGSCAVPMFLKPLIGFTTSTSLLTGLMVLVSHVG